MNTKLIASIVAAASLCSCSILESAQRGTTAKGSAAESQAGQTAVEGSTEADTTADTADSRHAAPSKLADELGGQWTIFQVGSKTIDLDEDMPYIIFEPSSGNFYASNGCNAINGQYTLSADNKIGFSNTLSTMAYCPDVDFQHDINVVIAETATHEISISHAKGESFLDFKNAKGKSVMRLRRGNLEFLNGPWKVTAITGIDHLEAEADIFFDIAELKLHGNTGCNYVNGSMYLDHRRANAIDISGLGHTRMACPNTAQETAYLVALEQTATAVSDGNDRVILLDSNGNRLMTLSRQPLQPE